MYTLIHYEMCAAWFTAQIDEQAEKYSLSPAMILSEWCEIHADEVNLREVGRFYRVGREVLKNYDLIVSPTPSFSPMMDPAGTISFPQQTSTGEIRDQFIFFTPRIEGIRSRSMEVYELLLNLGAEDDFILNTGDTVVSITRLDTLSYCLICWEKTKACRSFIGSHLNAWTSVQKLERQLHSEFVYLRK